MKQFYSTLLFFISFLSFGQCPSQSTLTLSSQAEVDAFTTNYPNCTEPYSLTISGDDIVDLSPLSQITHIQEDLKILNNALLTSLDGLNILTMGNSATYLIISNNTSLQNISALNSLTVDISETLNISSNPALISLNGLQNTRSVYTYINNNDALLNLTGIENLSTNELYIRYNDALLSLEGLSGSIPAHIFIEDNQVLNDISALNDFTIYQQELNDWYPNLNINNNPSLSECNIQLICDILSWFFPNIQPFLNYNPNYGMNNNASGCNSNAEVALNCGIIPENDHCSNAFELDLNDPFDSYNTLGTQSSQVPNCNDSDDRVDVWFTFNSNTLSEVDIVIEGGFYDIQLWEGNCTSLTHVPNACGSYALENISITTNTQYYIQIWSDDTSGRGTNSGLFSITVQDATLSLEENEFDTFKLYPNPTSSILNFKGTNTVNSINIYNALGQLVSSLTPNISSGTIDTSILSSGLYFVEANVDDKSKTFKILKE